MSELTFQSESEFEKTRRERLLAFGNYKTIFVNDFQDAFEVVTDEMLAVSEARGTPAVRLAMSSHALAMESLAYLHLQYSAGSELFHLRNWLPLPIAHWERYLFYAVKSESDNDGRAVSVFPLLDTGYWDALRLVCFTMLLGHANELPRVAAMLDYANPVMDGLIERLIALFVPGRAPAPDECTRHLPYFKTLKIFSAEPDARPALVAKYLDEWYVASRREPYYDSHKKGREHSFLGYWCFEAAAITWLLQIDDSSYRDKEFYPKDLADYARSFSPHPDAKLPDTDRGRIAAGQRCPRSGWWTTPAKVNSRRYFEQGAIMPSLGSDYGLTIWQWDSDQSKPHL